MKCWKILSGTCSLLLMMVSVSYADVTTDPRYCGEPKRNSIGVIVRDQKEIAKFKAMYPCEQFAAKHGKTCSDFQIDHPIPLVCGGCDKVWNMQWLAKNTKTCAEKEGNPLCKDRYEQDAYCPDGGFHK